MHNSMQNKQSHMLPDYFIIFDLEYTSKENFIYKSCPVDENSEVIQLAAYKVKKNIDHLEVLESLVVYSKPTKTKTLSFSFVEKTGITQEMIDQQGVEFASSLGQFNKFMNQGDIFTPIYSWGNQYSILINNLQLTNTPTDQWEKNQEKTFYSLDSFFDKQINLDNQNAYNIQTAFKINPEQIVEPQNSIWKIYSIFITMNQMFKFGQIM